MAKQGSSKNVEAKQASANNSESFGAIGSKADLKKFLTRVRDRMADESAAAIYAASAVYHVLGLPNIYDILDAENKELLRDIWLRVKTAGFQMRNPPMLFASDEQLPAGDRVA